VAFVGQVLKFDYPSLNMEDVCESRIGIIVCIYSTLDLIFVVLIDVAKDKSLKKCLLILDLFWVSGGGRVFGNRQRRTKVSS
jgi:hypothetical protein